MARVSCRPAGQVDEVGDLRDIGAVAFVGAVGGDRRDPTPCGNLQAGGADRCGQIVTDREPHVRGAAGVDEPVSERGRVGPGHHLHDFRIDGQLRQRHGQQLDVIGGGVRSGVAGPQDPRQRLARRVQECEERVMPEPALVGRRRALLL